MAEKQQYQAQWHRPIETVADLREFIDDSEGRSLIGARCPVEANTTRASWAARALVTHAAVTRNTGEPLGEVLSDLLADLRHLADLTDPDNTPGGENFEDADGSAQRRYGEEIRGEL